MGEPYVSLNAMCVSPYWSQMSGTERGREVYCYSYDGSSQRGTDNTKTMQRTGVGQWPIHTIFKEKTLCRLDHIRFMAGYKFDKLVNTI